MKRNNLTTAVLAGLAGVAGIATTAQAVNLNPDGLGQVLIYPYYTVNGGNDTLMSVVNSTDQGKAVKVRYLEGLNSQEVLDFNLYLSEFDVWVAAITRVDDSGTPGIIIPDSSCTVPYLFESVDGVQPFVPFNLDDGGPSTVIPRATEGHMEIIEMGVLNNDEEGTEFAVTHQPVDLDGDGDFDARRPANCQQLVDAWTDFGGGNQGYWLDDSTTDLSAPTGGLFGRAAIVDVQEGIMYSYDARAIEGYTSDIEHEVPGNILPNLNSGSENQAYLFFDQDGDSVPEPLTMSFERTVDAVSAVFMHDTLMNEYNTADALNAQSEWVITFPTKFFYVNEEEAIKPFTSTFDGEACETVFFDIYDREEATVAPEGRPPIVSPAPPDPEIADFELCFEAQVVRFGADPSTETEIFGSSNFTNIDNDALARSDTNFESGWVKMFFGDDPDHELEGFSSDGPTQLVGLPVTGFWAVRFVNSTLEGGATLANYGGLFGHKYTRFVEADSDFDTGTQ